VVLNAWLKGLASGDQRRPTGSSSALEVLRDDVLCDDALYKYILLYLGHSDGKLREFVSVDQSPCSLYLYISSFLHTVLMFHVCYSAAIQNIALLI